MNFLSVFLCFAFCAFTGAVVQVIVKGEEGYYWRDYKGQIPGDALPGGKDKQGITYIGQALHIQPVNGKLMPGPLIPTDKKMLYSWGDNLYEVTKNVKVLCSHYKESFEWITTDSEKVKRISEDDLVLGGYDTDYPLFIGRKSSDGQVSVGFVVIGGRWEGFYYVKDGKSHSEKNSFEILTYKVKTPATESCPPRKVINININ